MIYGDRVRQIRKLQRKTQKSIAEAIGVKQSVISRIESNELQPSDEIVEALSLATGFSRRFFERPPGPEIPEGSLVFRARRTSSKLDYDEAQVAAELAYELALDLALRLRIRPATLPNLSNEPPRKAAQIARSFLGLSPDRPIANVIHALEQQGIFVIAIPMSLPGRDAFSTWAGVNPRFPLIFVPYSELGGRIRSTVSHELDHLLAPDFRGYSRLAEDNAEAFAGHFLAPESGFLDELPTPFVMPQIIPVARRWGVSPQFVIRRAVDLRHVSQRRGQQLYKELSARGYARKEPPGAVIPREKPRLFKRMVEAVYGTPVRAEKIADEFAFPIKFVTALLASYADRAELRASVPLDRSSNLLEFTLES